jgi:hypothetical protein
MSAPTSPVEVCNLSLDLLRYPELVTSIDTPEGDVESLAARWYDALRRSLLRMFPWNFARKRATIARDATAPAFEYADAYVLPNDYVNYVYVGDAPVSDPITDFVVEGDRLLIDNDGAASLQLCYIYDCEDVTLFDPIFLMFLVGETAVMFANSLTGLNKAIPAMEKFRDRWEAKARSKNGQENPPKVRYKSPLLTARSRGRRSTGSDGVHLFT